MFSLTKWLMFSAFLAASSKRLAMATEIDFGSMPPSPNGCSLSGGDSGYVCANTDC